MAIVTSKNKKRTVKIVKKMNFPINNIVCPSVLNKGKPYPDQMNIALKKAKINRNNVVYVGDMHVDYQFSKNARIILFLQNMDMEKIININIILKVLMTCVNL